MRNHVPQIDAKEFFVWYTGCSLKEAAAAFAEHADIFREEYQKADEAAGDEEEENEEEEIRF